jgi:hypothetical protein
MLRATASKVMWVGRATVFVVGLSVIVAVVLGVATMAFAGNGQPWTLGQKNTATAITNLGGSAGVDGPMLQLTNRDAGSDDTAVDLNVQSGEPPIDVNSTTKVSQLNADQLDGLSSGAFAAAYERIVVVSPVGTNNAQNGQALLNALASITDASANKPYLLYIEPETYDLGNGSLTMKPFVDIEGSGELNTVITSDVSDPDCALGTVNGADNAELRFLTVRNTGSSTSNGCKIAISIDASSPRLTHVTAQSTGDGGLSNRGVQTINSSTTMTDVTATAAGQTIEFAVGVVVGGDQSNLTIKQSQLTGRGSGSDAIQVGSSAPNVAVALSQLVGGVGGEPAWKVNVQCFNNYNANMAAVNC